jgi:hypothetical protein
MDMESITRWEDYSRAKDEMFVHTDVAEAPWYVVESEDKRRARINMIVHLLSTISYYDVQWPPVQLPHIHRRVVTNGHRGRGRPTFPTTPPRWRELCWLQSLSWYFADRGLFMLVRGGGRRHRARGRSRGRLVLCRRGRVGSGWSPRAVGVGR